MTDFQNWWDGYFHEINGQKETAQAAWQARGELDKAFAETQEADLSKCPKCGGEADNGHDRCIPPSPYYCTKCNETQEPVLYIDGGGLDGEKRMNKYIVMSVLWIALASVAVFSIINTKGSPCAVEVKYANSKATYVGYSL